MNDPGNGPDHDPRETEEAGMMLRLFAMFVLGISVGITLTMIVYEANR